MSSSLADDLTVLFQQPLSHRTSWHLAEDLPINRPPVDIPTAEMPGQPPASSVSDSANNASRTTHDGPSSVELGKAAASGSFQSRQNALFQPYSSTHVPDSSLVRFEARAANSEFSPKPAEASFLAGGEAGGVVLQSALSNPLFQGSSTASQLGSADMAWNPASVASVELFPAVLKQPEEHGMGAEQIDCEGPVGEGAAEDQAGTTERTDGREIGAQGDGSTASVDTQNEDGIAGVDSGASESPQIQPATQDSLRSQVSLLHSFHLLSFSNLLLVYRNLGCFRRGRLRSQPRGQEQLWGPSATRR